MTSKPEAGAKVILGFPGKVGNSLLQADLMRVNLMSKYCRRVRSPSVESGFLDLVLTAFPVFSLDF